MFKLNKQVDYALQFLIKLNSLKEGELLSLRSFSQESTISFLFLQKIVKQLKDAGIVFSVRGAHGGYKLEKELSAITLMDVIEAIEGPYGVTKCFQKKACPKEKFCPCKPALLPINKKISSFLNSTYLHEIASEQYV